MPSTKHTLDELARLGKARFDQQVQPSLQPEDAGKFVAIDVDTGEHELDEDDYAAISRLRARKPAADIWLMRVGFPTTCRIGATR